MPVTDVVHRLIYLILIIFKIQVFWCYTVISNRPTEGKQRLSLLSVCRWTAALVVSLLPAVCCWLLLLLQTRGSVDTVAPYVYTAFKPQMYNHGFLSVLMLSLVLILSMGPELLRSILTTTKTTVCHVILCQYSEITWSIPLPDIIVVLLRCPLCTLKTCNCAHNIISDVIRLCRSSFVFDRFSTALLISSLRQVWDRQKGRRNF